MRGRAGAKREHDQCVPFSEGTRKPTEAHRERCGTKTPRLGHRAAWLVPRGEDKRILLLSEIHGEDFENEPVHPARFVKRLKRQLKGVLVAGVISKLADEQDGSPRHHIRYSAGAERLFRDGSYGSSLWRERFSLSRGARRSSTYCNIGRVVPGCSQVIVAGIDARRGQGALYESLA